MVVPSGKYGPINSKNSGKSPTASRASARKLSNTAREYPGFWRAASIRFEISSIRSMFGCFISYPSSVRAQREIDPPKTAISGSRSASNFGCRSAATNDPAKNSHAFVRPYLVITLSALWALANNPSKLCPSLPGATALKLLSVKWCTCASARVSEVCASGREKNHNLAFQLFYALSMGRQLGAGPQLRR